MNAQTGDTVSEQGTLLWIERRERPEGATYEVIYEVDQDPDMLRQAYLPVGNLDAGACRGDRITIDRRHRSLMIRKCLA